MIQVTEINTSDDLAGYRLLWNSLLPRTRGANFFQTYDWLETYWRHHGDAQRLRVLIVSAADRQIGVLPLTVVTESTRLGRIRVLTYPLDGWGTFFGPIGPNPTATLTAGLRHIARTQRDWDLLDLRWVDADGIDAGRSLTALRTVGFDTRPAPFIEAAQIQLTGDWPTYLAGRNAKWRQNVRRTERRLEERGAIEYIRHRPAGRCYGEADPRWDLYDACETIARNSWQGAATDGTTLSHESVRRYLRAAHHTAAEAGGLDLNLLMVGGQPAAFAYNYHYAGSAYGLRAGYDPAVASEGAGTVLFARMIEDSFARGDRLIDLGPGSLEIKRNWATRVQTAYHYPYYAPLRLKSQALRMKRWLVDSRR